MVTTQWLHVPISRGPSGGPGKAGLVNVIVISKLLPNAYKINLEKFSHDLSGQSALTFSFHLSPFNVSQFNLCMYDHKPLCVV